MSQGRNTLGRHGSSDVCSEAREPQNPPWPRRDGAHRSRNRRRACEKRKGIGKAVGLGRRAAIGAVAAVQARGVTHAPLRLARRRAEVGADGRVRELRPR